VVAVRVVIAFRVVLDIVIDVVIRVVRGLAPAGDEAEQTRHLEERKDPDGADRDRKWRIRPASQKRDDRHAHSLARSPTASR
jgi:hypothetical protein